ncbi:PREDICTED: glucose dehydrogenase [FAD, quinone]-like [Nicrophorus vespilloides]|uniref:Glucose dehydrogenase [FAD, quinone]-like n=1 Tax=Nicrophorus vespilloides TaxID=110193 RepID=A0ABM1MM01_NICVS|nr:PREDICTED: glucose dehydrogenase [FAD, quinone]-like [Nicrophorus vespilloides]
MWLKCIGVGLVVCAIEAQMFGNLIETVRLYSDPVLSPPEADFMYEYDFIVVGAGSGGSVVANRLSENWNWTVLLLEAGKDENLLTDVPLMAALQTSSSYNWGYKSEVMKSGCLGLIGKRCNIPRGKALGGTSVMNFMLYTRGNKLDYDEWESLGNKGWSYKDVFKYFLKSEDCSKCESIDKDYHANGGYLKIQHPQYNSPILKRFLKAGSELGYKISDPNGKNHIGFSQAQATMVNGRRCSANKAFLKPLLQTRPLLQVTTRARVTKILINPKTKRAYGVEVIKNRIKYVIRARKEVIVSAGTINSPHLLMLSGIGPKEDLEKVNINVIKDAKVGHNLQDHMAFSTLAFLVNQSVTVSDASVQNPSDVLNYVINGKGPFTIPGGSLGLAFIQTKYAKKKDYPDMELVLGAGALNQDTFGTMRALLGIPDSFNERVYVPITGRPAFAIATVLMRPKSRGKIQLKDNNPLHWPKIIPNYFQNEDDVKVMVEGIKAAVAVSRTRAFADLGTRLHDIPFPGCEKLRFESDEYWSCAVRQVSTTLGHHVGTCKMGPDNHPDAVVDQRLRVKGIQGLRVVDGSVMPNIVAGHTNSVIMMIAEKASDMIKEDWRR